MVSFQTQTKIAAFLHLVLLTAVAGPDATAIIRSGEQILRGESTQSLMTMVIERPSYSRQLTLRSWALGPDKSLVEILDPPKEEGVSSLRVDNQMWNYLPRVDQVVRVPTSMMLQSWMGSDFTNDDLMKSSSLSRDYSHKILKKTKKFVLIECKPRAGAPVVWGKVQYRARIPDNLPTQQKYFDEHGAWVRTIDFSGFKKMDDRTIPTIISISTAEKGHRTRVTYQRLLYDRIVSPSLFDSEQLRSISQQGKVVGSTWFTKKMNIPRNQSLASPMRTPKRRR